MDVLSKLFPFRSGNRMWALVLLQGYLGCMVVVLVGGFVINFIEGDTWDDIHRRWGWSAAKQKAYGDTALDECIWFVIMTLHGMTFGEFMPISTTGHVITMVVTALGFWFTILMASVVLLSQLPGQKTKHLPHVLADMVNACWPSYLIYCILALTIGSQIGPYLSKDPSGFNDKYTGMYYMWCVAHRTVFGDIWPQKAEARYATIPFVFLSYIYPCYAMALIAVRRPSTAQHQQLLAYMNQHPEECMGPGYIVPAEAASSSSSSRGSARELQMNQMT
eukprot:TRINITY_DN92838_c0_g1_i1.p1 TRINITY_DN92838_c0_g1~~TRINITY_DN92838_c0_g1_i1.p1  ORF type:complete len:290 (-),score=35.68 TRINITY_DN92838_c0_g1_i1:169-999(-)